MRNDLRFVSDQELIYAITGKDDLELGQVMKTLPPEKREFAEYILELSRRVAASPCDKILKSVDAVKLLRPKLGHLDMEEIWGIFVTSGNKVKKCVQLFKGGWNTAFCDVREVIRIALEERAVGVIIAHNHPSGGVLPSDPDKNITERLKKACRLMDLDLVDHIIIGKEEHYSFADEGML